ncbi:Hint domain-containing protein [Leisingera sp. MMG026]|uniref:Hint domain-containing protein n=1 Tax=Leisingera sp. MMG026 TaxID=2909982 RepID=UPI001F4337D3|nr:Hint domain-containing protein [Leisingera sp. MMG026]MCF6433403.1 Hint domain-containing protein [Leisingera sp. MMG026]
MALRSFFAQDSSSLVVTSSSNGSIVGDAVINNSDTPNGTVFAYSGGAGTEVTLNDTGGGRNRFNDDRESDHVITDGGGIVSDGAKVESESHILVRELDGNGNPSGPQIRIYVFSQDGQTSNVWGFATDLPLEAGKSYVKTGGQNTGTSRYSDYVTCFGEGTWIDTADGPVAVEDLSRGQRVWTKDSGAQPIYWIAETSVRGTGAFAPVVFAPGAIGNDRELILSQQHRVHVELPVAEMLFGQAGVLVAAKHLCGLPGVGIREQAVIRYFHFMFDRHHIVRSNGVLTESFFLAPGSVAALDRAQRRELLSLFPSLGRDSSRFGKTAAMTLTSGEARVLKGCLDSHRGQVCLAAQ